MGNQVSQQLLVFGQSILLGFSAGLLYDLLRPFRLRLPRLTGLLDSLYCLAVGVAAFLFLLQAAEGELRGFAVLGALGGAILFFCAFSAMLRPIWAFWADTLAYLVHLLSIPLAWIKNFCEKMAFRGKNLFYFAKKCYTIRKTGWPRLPRRGGGVYGEKGSSRKKSQAARPRRRPDRRYRRGRHGRKD